MERSCLEWCGYPPPLPLPLPLPDTLESSRVAGDVCGVKTTVLLQPVPVPVDPELHVLPPAMRTGMFPIKAQGSS